jgi:hypothetical protein
MSGKFVIVDGDGLFWGGSSWFQEYPDGQTYCTLKAAKLAAETAARTRTRPCKIMSDYGLETERVVFRVPKGGQVRA